jgi:hypothetical protein
LYWSGQSRISIQFAVPYWHVWLAVPIPGTESFSISISVVPPPEVCDSIAWTRKSYLLLDEGKVIAVKCSKITEYEWSTLCTLLWGRQIDPDQKIQTKFLKMFSFFHTWFHVQEEAPSTTCLSGSILRDPAHARSPELKRWMICFG